MVDREQYKCYWAHISESAVIWTGKGAKIFVPRQQTVDKDNYEKLAAVAARATRGPNWEGSAWTDVSSVPDAARLRYALITPRLIAPHPNSSPDTVEPEQAIAALVQCRFKELDEQRRFAKAIPELRASPYRSAGDASKSSNIVWRFYAALHEYIESGNLGGFTALIRRNIKTHILAAITAAYVAVLIENGRPQGGLECLQKVAGFRRRFSVVDQAWLDMQRARCLRELGHDDLARQISISLQALPKSIRGDPTARAIAASAALQILTTAPWYSRDLSTAIRSTDTAAAWWRSQVTAWGLGEMLDQTFTSWSAHGEVPLLDREVFWHLRSASLLSGFAGDHAGWRQSVAQVAKYGLQAMWRNSNSGAVTALLSDLRFSGDSDDLWVAAHRIVLDGPADAVKQASALVELNAMTVTTALSDIRLLTAAGDVLDEERADAVARWALKTVRNPGAFTRQVNPSFRIDKFVLELLAAVLPSTSKTVGRQVIRHILELPPVKDVGLATFYAPVVERIKPSDWTPKSLEYLALRRGDVQPLATIINVA